MRANSYVCRSYRGKTGWGSLFAPPPPPLILNRVKGNYKLYESRGDKDRILSAERYLNMMKPYLGDLINDHKKAESGEWKIRLNMHVNFISSKDTGEIRNINILSDSKEIMWGNETNDIITNLF